MRTLATPTLAVILTLAACGTRSEERAQPTNEVSVNAATEPATTPSAPQAPQAPPPEATLDPRTLRLGGLGDLTIGKPVPAGSSWKSRGAQVPDGCTTITSPHFPGAYAIVEEGAVRRITIGQRSDIKLAEGIGSGSSEEAVRAAFPGFREEPHKYVEAPAKYLTAPNAESGDTALRFEIGREGKVSLIHVGTMPVLGYVEGCS